MNGLRQLNPEWPLRIGFGLMYLYSGSSLILHPTSWHWALPYWFPQAIPIDLYLRTQGAVEICMAIVFICWFMKPSLVRLVSFLAMLEFAGILISAFIPFSAANFLITFRDIGLLGGAVALVIITKQD